MSMLLICMSVAITQGAQLVDREDVTTMSAWTSGLRILMRCDPHEWP